MILLPIFVSASILGMGYISQYSFGDERGALAARIGNLSARATAAIDKLSATASPREAESILSLLLADPAVSCAEIRQRDGINLAKAPPRIGCANVKSAKQVTLPLHRFGGAQLLVSYNSQELEDRNKVISDFLLLAMLGAVVIAAFSSLFAFNVIVGKPISALLRAIHLTRTSGKPVMVEHSHKDSISLLMRAFNAMQKRIADDKDKVTRTLAHLERIYNDTPAMMFSICHDGRIVSASGHWLDHTGFSREQTLGHPATDFILSTKDVNDGGNWVESLLSGTAMTDEPLVLRCQDGRRCNVLLNAVSDVDNTKLCVLSDITSLTEAHKELEKRAVTCALTGLANRRALLEHLANCTSKPGKHVGVMFIDLDNFKTVNDTLGHQAGDELLVAAAGRLRNCIAKGDLLCRLGGDEFAIVLHGMATEDDAQIVANRIIAAFASAFRIGAATAHVGTSIGIAVMSEGRTGDDLLRLADLAMYEAKQSGKNCFATYTQGMQAKVIARDLAARKIRDALLGDGLDLHLQPILDLETMKPVGSEALLRFITPRDGMLPTADMIQVAEETGLIKSITAWSVNEIFKRLSRLQETALSSTYLALNVSAHQVTAEFADEMMAMMQAHHNLAGKIVLEITETALFKRGTDAHAILTKLRQAGYRVALDDFGTGYSSLAHLHQFPVDIIKLDRSFISNLATADATACRSRALVKATAAMASELGISVVAEGIENTATLELLRSYGVTYGQGYLFTPALSQPLWHEWMTAFTPAPGLADKKAASQAA